MAIKAVRTTTNARAGAAALRRAAIVNAALDEFVKKGFAAARIEDIARRAGVAKGTIYLNFSDKEALFEAILKQEIRPKVDSVAVAAASDGSFRGFLDMTLLPMLEDLVHTRRGAVLRLLIGEAERFPKLAEVYFRVVIEPGLDSIRVVAQGAMERGELRDDLLLEFPQMLIAPVLLSVIWAGLFERFRHLDVERMVRGYFEHIAGDGGTRGGRPTPQKFQ